MSIPVLEWALDADLRRPTDKGVLIALAWHANAQGEHAYPSNESMQRKTSLSERTIRDALRRLEAEGWIEFVGLSPKRTRQYRLMVSKGARAAGGESCPLEGARAAPERSIERSNEEENARAPAQAPLAPSLDAVQDVWQHYVAVMERRGRGAELGREERRLIEDALKVATVDELKVAIDGCRASEFHMGRNERRKRYNQLGQIMKGKPRRGETTRDRIEFFMELAEKSGLPSGLTSVDPARLAQAKRDVLDAWEFPRDEHAQVRGNESADWLARHGVVVRHGADGRPIFESG
jgi:hypothetical protein